MSKKKQKEKKLIAGYKKPVFYTMIGVILIGSMMLFPSLTYPFHVVRCGRLPITATDFAAGLTYKLPGDMQYFGIFNSYHFCSENEAKEAGYRRTLFRTN